MIFVSLSGEVVAGENFILYRFTCNHGDVCKFVKTVKAEYGVKIDASVPNARFVKLNNGVLNTEQNVRKFCFCDLFAKRAPNMPFFI